MQLGLIFRNFELRLIEGVPVVSPLERAKVAKCGDSLEEFVVSLNHVTFRESIQTAIEDGHITECKAYISKKAFDKLPESIQQDIDDAIFKAGLKLILSPGNPAFGSGGLYKHSLILV